MKQKQPAKPLKRNSASFLKLFKSNPILYIVLITVILFFSFLKISAWIELYEVKNLIQKNLEIIETENERLINAAGEDYYTYENDYRLIKEKMLVSDDDYLVSFSEKSGRGFLIKIISLDDYEDLKERLKDEMDSFYPDQNKIKLLKKMVREKQTDTEYYYRSGKNFIHVCKKTFHGCHRVGFTYEPIEPEE